jgi:hypothetical protein
MMATVSNRHNKKADVRAFPPIGLLIDPPPVHAGCPSFSHPTVLNHASSSQPAWTG